MPIIGTFHRRLEVAESHFLRESFFREACLIVHQPVFGL